MGNVLGGGALGRADGLIKQPANTTISNNVNNAYTINLSDFIFMDNLEDDDVTRSRKGSIRIYDASVSYNGVCDFASARTAVQGYYTANANTLPYLPTDTINYLEATDGQYYPYIWARAVEANIATGNRRFWSVADGFEVTQNVTTRSSFGINFQVQLTQPTGDGWTRIARIEEWSQTGGVVELSSDNIKWIYLADNLLPLPLRSNSSPVWYSALTTNRFDEDDHGGILGAMRIINDEMQRMRSGGTFDSEWGASSTNRRLAPLLSLDGLYDAVNSLDGRKRLTRRVSSVITVYMKTGTNSAHTVSMEHINNANTLVEYAEPSALADFKLYETMNVNNVGVVSFPFDVSVARSTPTLRTEALAALSCYGLDFGQAFNGFHVSGTIEPISAIADDATARDFDWLLPSLINNSSEMVTGDHHCYLLADSASGSNNEIMKITERTGKNQAGADVTYYGLRFAVSNLRRFATQTTLDTQGLYLKFRVDLTLTEPTE